MSRYSRPPNTSLYVRNVPEGTRAEELRSMFGKYGPLTDVYVPVDYYTRRVRGFAYIQYPLSVLYQGDGTNIPHCLMLSVQGTRFEDPRDADDALYHLDRTRFFGRELEIEFARGDRKTPNQMRGREKSRSYRGYEDYGDRRRRSYRSRSRSPKRSRSRSPRRERRSYSRSRSRSRSYERSNRRSRSYSRSRSGSPPARRDAHASRSRTPPSDHD
ncbi:hypothetical protein ScPMuIL_000481 [Solemya velum]